MPDPILTVKSLLASKWSASATSLADEPIIATHSANGEPPSVVVKNMNESPYGAGPAGYSGVGGGTESAGVQDIDGTVDVYCTAGSVKQLKGAAEDGSDINPLALRFELYNHAADLVVEHQLDTELGSVAPSEANSTVKTVGPEDDPTELFGAMFRVKYTYDRR